MGRKVGPWTINGDQQIYENPWIRLTEFDVTQPDGRPGIYGVVHFKNLALGILPVFEDGTVLLVGQHRFAFDAYSWEVPAGGGLHPADPLASAQRELREETGYSAQHWEAVLHMDLSNSVTDERAVCFIAAGLEPGEPDPDGTEELQVQRVPFAEALDRALNGEITDAISIALLLRAHIIALTGEGPGPICESLRAGL